MSSFHRDQGGQGGLMLPGLLLLNQDKMRWWAPRCLLWPEATKKIERGRTGGGGRDFWRKIEPRSIRVGGNPARKPLVGEGEKAWSQPHRLCKSGDYKKPTPLLRVWAGLSYPIPKSHWLRWPILRCCSSFIGISSHVSISQQSLGIAAGLWLVQGRSSCMLMWAGFGRMAEAWVVWFWKDS